MGQNIYKPEEENFLVLKIDGIMNRKIAKQYFDEAHRKGIELGINKFLYDLTNATNTESNMDNYLFANTDIRNMEDIDLNTYVAMVVSPNDHSHDFIETVSRNAGLNVTLFRDYSKAVEYLKNHCV
jgi:hypothetical protein